MKSKFILVVILAFFVLPFGANAEIKLLLKDLKKGDTSADVKVLQQILNQDPATKVASFGAGSPGYETMYFGTLTEAAVKKFQEKHKALLSSASGSYVVTGRVDVMTRMRINNMAISSVVIDQSVKTEQTSTSTGSSSNSLSITSVSPENPTPGETIHIYGTGFTRNSYVYLGLNNKISFDYVNSKHIKIKVPSNAEPAVDLLYIKNLLGDTSWTQPIFTITTDEKIADSGSSGLKSSFEKIKLENKKYTSKVAIAESEDKLTLDKIGRFFKDIFSAPTVFAATNSFFGGKITQVYYCTCFYDVGIILDIQDKASNNMTYTTVYKPLISTLHSNYVLEVSGPNVVGGTMPTSYQCQDTYYAPPAEPYCAQSTSGGTTASNMVDILRGVGTTIMMVN